ncbi:MAG TPA: recombinase RecT [Candidatus Kryptobacter bacterium]|nr:recombinase RecT [Candidatus Kryptobacter bacterium]
MSNSGQALQASQQKFGIKAAKELLKSDEIAKAFHAVLDQEAGGFLMSVTQLISNKNFEDVEVSSVLGAAMVAATLRLPVVPSLGFAAIIPYFNGKRKVKEAQFQIMKNGYVQLALRTAQYNIINADAYYEGEVERINRMTGAIELKPDFVIGPDSKVAGYFSYIRLNSGYEHQFWKPIEWLEAHGKRYSKSYFGLWTSDFDKMALKTVLKLNIKHYGEMSTALEMAQRADQSVARLTDAGAIDYDYPDNPEDEEGEIEAPKSKEETILAKIEKGEGGKKKFFCWLRQ